jgi:hypothetical protein
MLKRFRVVGLCLAAMFAFSAVAVAAAQAAEFTVFPDPIVKATAKAGELLTVGNRDIKCEGGSTTGKVETATTTVNKEIVYTGCKSTKFGAGSCQNGVKGEIKTNELEGRLVETAESKTGVAIVFKPKTGTVFATFECETFLGAEKIKVTGEAGCEASPVKVKSTKGEVICTQTKGVSSIKAFKTKTQGEGAETFGPEESGVTQTTEVEYEKEEEIT